MPILQMRPIVSNMDDEAIFNLKEGKRWKSHLEIQYNKDLPENKVLHSTKLDSQDINGSVQSFGTANSNTTTPTLTSDNSSTNSTVSGVVSPVTSSSQFESSSRQGSNHIPTSTKDSSTKQPYRRQKSVPLVDNTSMASLTIANPSTRMKQSISRSRKQREIEFEDDDDNILPNDSLMFNVPMSPALCAQQNMNIYIHQRGRSLHRKLKPHHKMRNPIFLPETSRKPPPLMHNGGSVAHQSCTGSFSQTNTQHQISPNRKPIQMPNHQSLPSIHENMDLGVHTNNYMSKRHSEPIAQLPYTLSSPSLLNHRASYDSLGAPTIYRVDSDVSDIAMELYKLESQRLNSLSGTATNELHSTSNWSLKSSSSSNSSRKSEESSNSRRASLTRPENLPPKPAEEERRHLKEYEQLMKYAAAADKKKQQKFEEFQKHKAKQAKLDLRTWNNWLSKDTKIKLSSSLKWRGIPESIRGAVWLAQKRCEFLPLDQIARPTSLPVDYQIIEDCELIWPECGIFGRGRPLHDSLISVVKQYLANRPEVSYNKALMGLSALLLLYLDADNALLMLLNIIQPGSLPHAILCGNERITSANYVPFNKILSIKFDNLNEHFAKVDVTNSELLNPMISGIFTTIVPSPQVAARLMDVFIFEGDTFLLRASLGILRINEAWLYTSRSEILQQLQKPRLGEEDDLMNTIREVTRT